MKIEKTKNTNKIIQFKPKSKNGQTTFEERTRDFKPSPVNPEFYQSQLGILKNYLAIPQTNKKGEISSLTLHMPISGMGEDDKVILNFYEQDSLGLFLDSNGNINRQVLDFFATSYIKEFEEIKQKYETEKEILTRIINEKPQRLKFYSPNETHPELQTALEKSLYQIINYNERIETAARVLNRNENQYKNSIYTVGQELINVIKLSLNESDNLDLSNLEQKKAIAKKIDLYSRTYEQDWSNTILEYSTAQDGKIDLDFCECLTKILVSCIDDEDVSTRIYQASIVVRKIMEQYPTNYKKVVDGMIISFTTGEENIFS